MPDHIESDVSAFPGVLKNGVSPVAEGVVNMIGLWGKSEAHATIHSS